jgi:hypothetical protein
MSSLRRISAKIAGGCTEEEAFQFQPTIVIQQKAATTVGIERQKGATS